MSGSRRFGQVIRMCHSLMANSASTNSQLMTSRVLGICGLLSHIGTGQRCRSMQNYSTRWAFSLQCMLILNFQFSLPFLLLNLKVLKFEDSCVFEVLSFLLNYERYWHFTPSLHVSFLKTYIFYKYFTRENINSRTNPFV